MEPTPSQIEEQLELEEEMVSLGADVYDNTIERTRRLKRESLCGPGDKLASMGVAALIENIEMVQAAEVGKFACYLRPMKELPADVVAGITMRVVVDKLSQERKASAFALEIGAALWAETMLNRAGFFELRDHLAQTRWLHLEEKVKHITRMENTTIWTLRERQSIGMVLLQLVAQHTGIVRIDLIQMATRKVKIVNATEECFRWLEGEHGRRRLLRPMRLPMLIKPRPWTSIHEGGYLTPLPGNTLIKDAKPGDYNVDGSEPFIQAANRQQEVGWRVNQWLLSHANDAWQRSLGIGCMARSQGYEMPPYPAHLPVDHPDVAQWKHNARIIHEKNDGEQGRRIQNMKTLWVADRFKDRDAFYYPMQMDFRGRFYYRCFFLNPQGSDLARALLEFAEGKPIVDDDSLRWLMVHGANVYGLGKESWDARVRWVKDHQAEILAIGSNPWGWASAFWQGAKQPWQFLAFCHEYSQFWMRGFGYRSHLPVQLDCTCSGIQHFAALLRDPVLAEMVNLTPSEEPRDIYTTLTSKVLEELRVESERGDSRAKKWLTSSPDRSLTKPVVMTLAYSATRRSIMQHCQTWAHERGLSEDGVESWPFKPGGIAACYWMSDMLYNRATELIASAAELMTWFRKLGSAAGKANIPLQWTSPSGMTVLHRYLKYEPERVQLKTRSSVTLIQTTVYDHEIGLATRQMGQSLSPNVIHSLDSAHMALTVNDAKSVGIDNIGGIHDCFLTTAGEMTQLRRLVRATFVEMYSEPVLESIAMQLKDCISATLQNKLPDLPKVGSFDIDQVTSADYFIS